MSEPAENSDGTVRNLRSWKPGQSGNPGGRPKGVARAFRDALGGPPAVFAQVLLEIAIDPTARNADRITAAREILDRGWGKAVGFTDIEGADPLGDDEVQAEIRAIAEQLERERHASWHPRAAFAEVLCGAQAPYRGRGPRPASLRHSND